MSQTEKTEPSKKQKTEIEKRQLELGRQLYALFETGYVSRRKMLLMNFVRGIAQGFGAVVGATIVVAVVLWILSLFDQIPFVDAIRDSLQSVPVTTPSR